jgi:hypothetical protein
MHLYRINTTNRYFDGVIETPPNTNGIPYGTTKVPPPELNENEYAIWSGSGWTKTTIAPRSIQIEETEETNIEEVYNEESDDSDTDVQQHVYSELHDIDD